MSVLLGIDLGTSSVKAMLLDSEHGVVAVEAEAYDVDIPKTGYAEQKPQMWWLHLKNVFQILRERNKTAFQEICAVCFSGQMHGVVLVDAAGTPLRPAILWLDQRAKSQVQEINQRISPEAMGEIFHNRVVTGFAFPTLLWLKENEPETLEKAAALLMPKDYIRLCMTGEIGCEVSDASATALFRTGERRWAYDIINAFGLPERIFRAPHESTELAGLVSSECEKECGLRAGIPVFYGCGDQMAQSIGNGVCSEAEVISNIGTGGQISAYIQNAVYDKKLRTHTFCHAVNHAFTIYGATLCSGLSLKWLKNQILRLNSFQEMSYLAEQVRPGSGGLIFLPYLAGERTPHMDPGAKGAFWGLTLEQDRAFMARAVMEGVVFSLRDSLMIFKELGLECRQVIASGGGAQSEVWLQIQADIFNKEIKVCTVNEQACLGACILAGVGSGVLQNVREGIDRFVSFKEQSYRPVPEHVAIYNKQYQIFREIYPAMKKIMERD